MQINDLNRSECLEALIEANGKTEEIQFKEIRDKKLTCLTLKML
jgi:hypothetical protein